jgi:signal transduction histidine kinase
MPGLYVALAILGRGLTFVGGVVSVFWLPAAVAAVASWFLGYRAAISVLIGQFVESYVISGDDLVFALTSSLGNGLGTATLAWLLHRPEYERGFYLERSAALRFLLALAAADLINATFGVVGLTLGFGLSSESWPLAFWNWWCGDVGAALVLAPVAIHWLGNHDHKSRLRSDRKSFAGLVMLGATLAIAGSWGGDTLPQSVVFIVVPPLLWIVLSSNVPISLASLLVSTLTVTVLTVQGQGPFASENPVLALLQLQIFVIVLATTIIATTALASENRKQVETLSKQALELEERVNERTAQLEQANIELSRLNEEKNAFLAVAAHDLQNPITVIIGAAGLLGYAQEHGSTLPQSDLIAQIRTHAERMRNLVRTLLDFNRIEMGAVVVKAGNLDLSALVSKLCEHYAGLAREEGIAFESEVAADLRLKGDEVLITSIIENLLSNATKYTPRGGTIRVRLEASGRLVIGDTGLGIAPSEQGAIFEKFAGISNRPLHGQSSVGLGLYAVKKWIEMINGSIRFESQVGVGTTFYVTFCGYDLRVGAGEREEVKRSA